MVQLQPEGDKSYRDSPHLKKAKEATASCYLLYLGTNDSKIYNRNAQRYEIQLSEWIRELKGGGNGWRTVYTRTKPEIRKSLNIFIRSSDRSGMQIRSSKTN